MDLDAEDGQVAGPPVAADQDHTDHAGEQQEVVEPLDTERLRLPFRVNRRQGLLPAEVVEVHGIEDRQQDQGRRQHVGEQAGRDPEEGHVVQKAKKEGRVPEGGEGPSDVGDQKDEEADDMGLLHAVPVGAQDRPDHHHGGARSPDPGCQDRADQQHGRVDRRGSPQGAPQHDAAGNREQPPEQDDEGDVVDQRDVKDLVEGHAPMREQKREGEEQRPESRHLAEMMVPEPGREQRAQGDGQQDSGKGDDRPDRQGLADGVSRRFHAGGQANVRPGRHRQNACGKGKDRHPPPLPSAAYAAHLRLPSFLTVRHHFPSPSLCEIGVEAIKRRVSRQEKAT